MHLEGRNHMTCRNIQFAGLRRGITRAGQLCLKPADGWQLYFELCLLARYRLLIRPDSQAFGSQTLPGEQRPRIKLAQRGDVAVADDAAGVDGVTLADVLEQDDQGLDLVFAVGIPEGARSGCP